MELASGLRAGQVVAGKYRLERVIGAGGMGLVFAATNLELQRMVALKCLRRDRLAERHVARFAREARLAARLVGPHVARILDAGSFGRGRDLTRFIALEYLEGVDLACLLEHGSSLGIPDAVGIVRQACEALSEAHALEIVHRDMKPANVFLSNTSGGVTVKILDFGIAKRRGEIDSLTTSESVVGSPAYMAPEQLRSARLVDGRADIWSLGVILYQSLVRRLPFESHVFADLCIKILVESPAPIPTEREIPPGLEEIVRRCLAKDPGQRYANAADLASALVPYASSPWQMVLPEDLLGRESSPVGSVTAGELEALRGSRTYAHRVRAARRRSVFFVTLAALGSYLVGSSWDKSDRVVNAAGGLRSAAAVEQRPVETQLVASRVPGLFPTPLDHSVPGPSVSPSTIAAKPLPNPRFSKKASVRAHVIEPPWDPLASPY